jgi:phosphopantetheine adenylyltransferase
MKPPYLRGFRQGFLEQTVYSIDFLLGIFQALGIVIFEVNHDSLVLEIEKSQQATIINQLLSRPNIQDLDIQGIPLTKIIEGIFKEKR